MMPNATVKVQSFVCFLDNSGLDGKVQPVETRTPESLNLPEDEECIFYFFDSYVGVVDETEYRFGPKMNVSPKYYKGGTYYPNPDHFRVYHMRCWGWSEEKIKNFNPEDVRYVGFWHYNKKECPNGILIVHNMICNPNNGIILSSKKTVTDYVFPSEEVLEAYRNYDD